MQSGISALNTPRELKGASNSFNMSCQSTSNPTKTPQRLTIPMALNQLRGTHPLCQPTSPSTRPPDRQKIHHLPKFGTLIRFGFYFITPPKSSFLQSTLPPKPTLNSVYPVKIPSYCSSSPATLTPANSSLASLISFSLISIPLRYISNCVSTACNPCFSALATSPTSPRFL